MSLTNVRRPVQAIALLLAAIALGACGFHLRENARLPASMQRVHLTVNGDSYFQRQLARTLETSGATVEDDAGPGIAEFQVPTAAFSTDTLTSGGYARISEYSIHYAVQFQVTDAAGQALVPLQHINMSREYSYDASDTIGNASQVEQIQKSLDDDMVQAILFRLQAAAQHPASAPAAAASVH
ncbi:MAG TPA: LPS assembly lipoprotein LptE [Rhodanobacter sp.]|nr:LPS assembly lipoprotein LptE [Rhodanobacter sp.]